MPWSTSASTAPGLQQVWLGGADSAAFHASLVSASARMATSSTPSPSLGRLPRQSKLAAVPRRPTACYEENASLRRQWRRRRRRDAETPRVRPPRPTGLWPLNIDWLVVGRSGTAVFGCVIVFPMVIVLMVIRLRPSASIRQRQLCQSGWGICFSLFALGRDPQ